METSNWLVFCWLIHVHRKTRTGTSCPVGPVPVHNMEQANDLKGKCQLANGRFEANNCT